MDSVEFSIVLSAICVVLGYHVGVFTERDRRNPPPRGDDCED